MEVNTWYNGKPITHETLLKELKESLNTDDGDLERPWLIEYIATTSYTGRKEDLEYLVEKLNEKGPLGYEYPEPNLETVEKILSKGEWHFAQREAKISYRKSGRGTVSPSISLPNTWLRAMGINEGNRDVKLSFDGERITIEKEA